ncbi:MAG TPA: hypothetical protein DCS93_44425 [Microscillaceae bacterium]|nr:hypothetical protein [Microscillaceae bacterium]
MGFGFNFLMLFGIFPLTIFLIIIWLINRKKLYVKALAILWISVLGLIALSYIARYLFTKKGITKRSIYGEYIIDRTKFPGKQADWQYQSFRFKITADHQFIFYYTEGAKVIKSDTAQVVFLEKYFNHRMIIKRNAKMHHIVEPAPALYSKGQPFYYVFRSPKFGNVFFKKGIWKPLNK